MTEKQKRNLYLFTALLCFIGIIVVFFVDGYLGIYDTVYVKSMEQEQTVDFETNMEWKPYIPIRWEEMVSFRYEIDNRSFFNYSTLIEISLWQSEKQVVELFRENILVSPFDKKTLNWTLDTARLEKPIGREINYTLKIKGGKIEREFILALAPAYTEQSPYPLVPPPAPVPIK